MPPPTLENGFLGADDDITRFYKSISELIQKNNIPQSHKWLCSVVESRVCARTEVSGSNPDLLKYAYFVKNYTSVVEGLAVVDGWLGDFFYFLIFYNFFIFWKLICRGMSRIDP